MNEDKTVIFVGSIYGHGTGYAGCVYDPDGICPTLNTMQGGGREPHILMKCDEERNSKDKTGN